MTDLSDDRTDEVLDGLQRLVDAGRVAEVEELLTTIVDSELAERPTAQEREMRSYAEGMRDGIAFARRQGG